MMVLLLPISRLVFFCQFASVSTVSCKLFFCGEFSSRFFRQTKKKKFFFMCFDFFVELYVDVLFVEV